MQSGHDAPSEAQNEAQRRPWLSLSDDALADSLRRVERVGAAAVPALSLASQRTLARVADQLSFRTARPVVGSGERAVTQSFEIADDVPETGPLAEVADALAQRLNAVLARDDTPACAAIAFNDRVVQRYPPGDIGISPHKDHVRYVHLVVNLVLRGVGRFYVCPERSFAGALEIPGSAGDALIMRAPGFAGSDNRPFHAIGAVAPERLVLGLRQDART
ncbi:hypothetical protein CKO28_14975 [Rhodovibrio sodomensis]|uniref:Fe2OG dioxygenase domain-containing protein n=1 Tax=Rhodovibrio sodomensis TaxID=1088 RepID=A0ABS1DFT4_9PROT|nr:hypothetical protein [Rhodovibrio sodomensis]MBK1669339.1 hypothetical protein [Rhodovibrio sodomensis]